MLILRILQLFGVVVLSIVNAEVALQVNDTRIHDDFNQKHDSKRKLEEIVHHTRPPSMKGTSLPAGKVVHKHFHTRSPTMQPTDPSVKGFWSNILPRSPRLSQPTAIEDKVKGDLVEDDDYKEGFIGKLDGMKNGILNTKENTPLISFKVEVSGV
jgi:hypothetical protein